VPRKAGPKVVQVAIAPRDADVAPQMTLLTNGVSERGLKIDRVNDRLVKRSWHLFVWHLFVGLVPLYVQLTRAVTALAANRIAMKNGRPVAIHRFLDVIGEVGVAEQALGGNGPCKVLIPLLVPGRQSPGLLLRIPGDRRKE
jgi:hypothetical protein